MTDTNKKPVTATIAQSIDPSCQDAYEALLVGIHSEVRAFGGFLRREIIKSSVGPFIDYTFILHFDNEDNLHRWERSAERAQWITRMSGLAAKTTPLQVLTGLETWFTLKPGQAIVPPPRYKMAIVTWVAIFPLISLQSYAMKFALGDMHTILHAFIATMVLVPLMTYIVMPRMTRLMHSWLYPREGLESSPDSCPS